MHHVNSCLDQEENAAQAANKLAQRNFDACPICFKDAECNVDHLRRCAKQRSVLPKDLISVIERYEQQVGAVTSARGRGRGRRTVAANRRQKLSKKTAVAAAVDDLEEIIPAKASSTNRSHHFSKQVSVVNGRLTTRAHLPDRTEVQARLDALLTDSILVNFINDANSPVDAATSLPELFSLASLLHPHCFMSRGFDSLVAQPSVHQQLQPATVAQENGFLQQDLVTEIDCRNQMFDLLWQQKDRKSADLLIRTRDQVDVACHSFVWCMNCSKARLTRCGSMFRADCSAFSQQTVQTFVAFCYSGRMSLAPTAEQEMRALAEHLQCIHLFQ